MTVGIYQIYCSKNNKIYIGSSTNIERRYTEHIRDLKAKKHYNNYLQSSFNKYGVDSFIFSIIEECNREVLLDREQFYLDQLFEGGNTFNIALVAGKPKKNRRMPLSKETKYKIGLIHKGRKKSDDHKNKISITKKGTVVSEETKVKMSIAAKNRKITVSQETRDKISKINKNKTISDETRKNMSLAQKSRVRFPHSEETKRKISESNKARKANK